MIITQAEKDALLTVRAHMELEMVAFSVCDGRVILDDLLANADVAPDVNPNALLWCDRD